MYADSMRTEGVEQSYLHGYGERRIDVEFAAGPFGRNVEAGWAQVDRSPFVPEEERSGDGSAAVDPSNKVADI